MFNNQVKHCFFAIILAVSMVMMGRLGLTQAQSGDRLFVDIGQDFGDVDNSQGVATADLDNDGDLDAFVANNGSNAVWFNRGSGAFVNGGQVFPATNSRAVVLGDVNGDGNHDAVIANDGPNVVWINLGAAKDYTFSDKSLNVTISNTFHYLGAADSQGVALGDVDNDKDLDLFVVNNGANRIWLNSNTQPGVFSDSGQTLGNANSTAVLLVDSNQDGLVEFAFVTNNGAANTVWVNDGNGNFTDTGLALGNAKSLGAALGDLDGDGDMDVFVVNDGPNQVWVNDGKGSFSAAAQTLGSATSHSVSLADADGDGDLDAYVANSSGANKLWVNDGSGNFSEATQTFGTSNSQAVSFVNLNGQGVFTKTDDGEVLTLTTDIYPDAFVVNANQANKVWLNLAPLEPIRPRILPSPNSYKVSANEVQIQIPFALAGDLDNNSTLKIHAEWTGSIASKNTVNDNRITAVPLKQVKAGETLHLLASPNQQRGYMWAIQAETIGGLGRFSSVPTDQLTPNLDHRAVALGDLDGDDDLDAFVVGLDTNQTFANSGRGDFTVIQDNFGDVDSYDVALGDLDGDGDLDAFIASFGGNSVWINQGNGTFKAGSANLGNSNSHAVALGDMDNDGDLDAVVGNYNNGASQPIGQFNRVWLNDGAGNFSADRSIQLGDEITVGESPTQDVALGDFNEDGFLDAVFVNDNSTQQACALRDRICTDQIWLNQADGSAKLVFSGQRLNESGNTTDNPNTADSTSVAVGDVNGDGYLDLVIGKKDDHNQLWLNNGPNDGYTVGDIRDGGFSSISYFTHQRLVAPNNSGVTTRYNTQDVALVDIDGDKDLDFIEVNVGLGKDIDGFGILVFRNQYNQPSIPTRITTPVDIFKFVDGLRVDADLSKNKPVGYFHSTYGLGTGDMDGDGDIDFFAANAPGGARWEQGEDAVWLNQDDLKPAQTNPKGNGSVLKGDDPVEVIFTRGISFTSATNETFSILGKQSGVHSGTYNSPVSTTIQLKLPPGDKFLPGEVIFASLRDIQSADGEVSLPQPYIWQFRQGVLSGTGVYSPGQQLKSFAPASQDVILVDLDGDDDLDAFVVNRNSGNQLWLNENNIFTLKEANYGSNAQAAFIADLDKDGRMDAFIVGKNSTTIIKDLIGTPTRSDISNTSNSVAVDYGDFNHDGFLDAFVVNDGADHVIYLNDSGKGFITSTVASSESKGRAVAIGDVTADGFLDAIVVRDGENEVWIGNGSGGFNRNVRIGNTLGSGDSTDVDVADFNGDGFLDFVISNADSADTVWLNDGTGDFPETLSQSLPGSQNDVSRGVGIADVDADNDLDLFIVTNGANKVWLNGPFGISGRFIAGETFRTTAQVNNTANSQAVAMGDVDGDGDMDALVANSGTDNQIWENVPAAKLVISKVVADDVKIIRDGINYTYTLTITNVGSASASNLVITDRIPVGAIYNGPHANNGVVTFDKDSYPQLAALDVNSSTQVALPVKATDNFSNTIVNDDYAVMASELMVSVPGPPVTTPVEVRIKGIQINVGVNDEFLMSAENDPLTGFVSTPGNTNLYTFTAVITPDFASFDINYFWINSESGIQKFACPDPDPDLTGFACAPAENKPFITVPFSWTTLGPQEITFTVGNIQTNPRDDINDDGIDLKTGEIARFIATRTITISTLAAEELVVKGPEIGLLNQPYTFTAQVSPSEVTLPLTYVWQAVDQTPLAVGGVQSLDYTLPYTWDTPGRKVITVGVTNFGAFVTGTHVITILAAPEQITITGPITGLAYTPQTFLASVDPVTTSTPLTYIWQATHQPVQTYTSNLTHTVNFTWAVGGPQFITVTAFNQAGAVSDTHVITTTLFDVCQPISDVELVRLPVDRLSTDTQVRFTALISEGHPISFTWMVNDQLQTETKAALETQFSQNISYTVGVTVSNECSQVYLSEVVQVEPLLPDLSQSIKSVSNSTIKPGGTVLYSLFLKNIASTAAKNVTLTDSLPPGVTYNVGSATANGFPLTNIPADGPIVWSGDIISGTPIVIRYLATINTISPDAPVVNQATLTYSNTEAVTVAVKSRYSNGGGLIINEGALFTNIPTVTLSYGWRTSDSYPMINALLSNDGGFGETASTVSRPIISDTVNETTEQSWVLAETGSTLLPRTAFARFQDRFGKYYRPVYDDIIYDPVPPRVTLVEMDGLPARGFGTRQAQNVNLRVTMSDDNSGAGLLEISNMPAFTASQSFFVVTPTVETAWTLVDGGDVYLRVTDRAGNVLTVTTGAVPPEAITFSPPLSLTTDAGHSFTFTATVSPLNTTQPITYIWQADGLPDQAPVKQSSLTSTTSLVWPLNQTGAKTVTLTAINIAGVVSETYVIELPSGGIFLPIIMR